MIAICNNGYRCEVDCYHKKKHNPTSKCLIEQCINEDGVFGSKCIEYKEEPMIQKLETTADQATKADAGKLRYDLIEGSMLPNTTGESPFEFLKPGALTLNDINLAIHQCAFIIGSNTKFLEELAKAYTFGCIKYSEKSWQSVLNGRERYESAMFRHIADYKKGEWSNWTDGGCLHIAQIAWNLIAVKWFILQEEKDARLLQQL